MIPDIPLIVIWCALGATPVVCYFATFGTIGTAAASNATGPGCGRLACMVYVSIFWLSAAFSGLSISALILWYQVEQSVQWCLAITQIVIALSLIPMGRMLPARPAGDYRYNSGSAFGQWIVAFVVAICFSFATYGLIFYNDMETEVAIDLFAVGVVYLLILVLVPILWAWRFACRDPGQLKEWYESRESLNGEDSPRSPLQPHKHPVPGYATNVIESEAGARTSNT